MNKKIHTIKRWVLFPLLGLLFIAAVGCGSLLAWVITGPRSIASLTPYIESALRPAPDYKAKIENPEIRWEGWDNPLAVSIRNIDIINADGKTVAHFPEALVKVYLYKIILGKVVIKEVELIHPDVVLVQNDDGSFFVGSNDKDAFSGNSIAAVFGSSNQLSSLRSLVIKHARLVVENKASGIFLQSEDSSLEITRKHGIIKGTFSMPVAYDGRNSSITASLNMDKHQKTVEAQIFFKQIPTSAISKLFPGKPWLDGATLSLSGSLQVTSDLDANISDAKFILESGEGSIKYPAAFDEPVTLKQAKIMGDITENLNMLTVNSGKITLVGSDSKSVDLSFSGSAKKAGDDFGLNLQAETANISVNDVHRYWPLALAPQTRKWVTGHISNGTVTKADVTLNFKPGDLKMKDLPDEDLAANITLKGATVKYLPGHPPATDINGVVKFTGRSMDAKITSARYMNSDISQASIRMPDTVPDDVRMFLDMDIKAPAKDIAAFLALPKVEQAAKLGITQDITGQASGNVKFDFIAFSETNREDEDMNYAITANLIGVGQKNFMGKRDIDNANMALSLNNKGIKLNGTTTVNTVPMSIDLTTNFDKGHNTDYAIKCAMPLKALPGFDLPAMNSSSGSAGVVAKFHHSDTADTSEAKIDLAGAAVSIPEIGFTKKSGDPATLDLSTQQLPSGNTQIKPIRLKGTGIEVSGNAEIEKATGNLVAATFDRLHFNNTDLSALDFRQTPDGVKLTAQGNAFDLSPYLNNSKNLKKGKGYTINLKVAHLIFGENREMQNASIDLDCGAVCRSATIDAKLAEKNSFNYLIKDGKVTATSDNNGELTRVLGINEHVEGGMLTLDGAYKGDKIEGTLDVKNYTLKRAPILTKILTIASLTGFLDTLSGNGIAFSNLHIPFTYRDNIIVLKDGKTHGNALGLTASGTIDLDNSTIDLSGLLIPSYTVNSLIGNVPVIGDLLMGGKGKGILAMNYSLKGNLDDPSVSVNPLSAFTPGFMRGIFDVFDQPAPDVDKIVEDRKKAEESKKDVTLPAADAPQADPTPALTPQPGQ